MFGRRFQVCIPTREADQRICSIVYRRPLMYLNVFARSDDVNQRIEPSVFYD